VKQVKGEGKVGREGQAIPFMKVSNKRHISGCTFFSFSPNREKTRAETFGSLEAIISKII
jgi:hypothetical protein